MNRFLSIFALLMLAACGRTFEQRTARYAEVGPLCEERAAVLDVQDNIARWGYVDHTGRLVIECRYLEARSFNGRRAVVRTDMGFGYIDPRGRMVVTPHYAQACDFADNVAWVQSASALWGSIDTLGREIIPCLYAAIDAPDERGWMRAVRDGRQGYLVSSGEEVVPCVYDAIGEPNVYGLTPITAGGKHGFLGSDGREALPCFFAYITEFDKGYALTNYGGIVAGNDEPSGGLWGVIDSLGHETIPCRYAYLAAPGDGYAAFRLETSDRWGYVDMNGTVAMPSRFAVARQFGSGVAVVSYNHVDFGLIDRNGNEVSSFGYKEIGTFGDGMAAVNINPTGVQFPGMEHRCGYIDTQGREVIPIRYDGASVFSEMRAAVMRLGMNPDDFFEARWGYIAPSGQPVAPYKYHEAYPFSCGLARVFVKGEGYGYIDRKGTVVVPCKYQEAEDFHDFRARVKQYDRTLIIDEQGRIVGE